MSASQQRTFVLYALAQSPVVADPVVALNALCAEVWDEGARGHGLNPYYEGTP